jgi:hypothetical protein
MQLAERINSFVILGKHLGALPFSEKKLLFRRVYAENPWFTEENLELAWQNLLMYLKEETLLEWTSRYTFPQRPIYTVGLLASGQVPAAAFTDLMAVLLSGHQVLLKLSEQDKVLIPFLIAQINQLHPALGGRIRLTDRLNQAQVLLASGTDKSIPYLEHYFASKPRLLRKQRNSVAVLTGSESKEELTELGKDIFSFFGLSQQSVSKLYVPQGCHFGPLFEAIEPLGEKLREHFRYMNNYDYHHAMLLMNQSPHWYNGFVLILEKEAISSPTGLIYAEFYESISQAQLKLIENQDNIHFITSSQGHLSDSLPFGRVHAQGPWAYHAETDPLSFLSNLT